MFDTFAHIANIAKEIPVPETEGLSPDDKSDIEELKEWNRHLQQILSLKDDRDLPCYDGDVLYFNAEVLSMQLKTIQMNAQELDKKKQENLDYWNKHIPHMSIYHVAVDHFTMLDERFCNEYIGKINDIVLPHNY